MEQPPTPYIWRYEPSTGFTAGASQDYGAVINWLNSDLQMFHRVKEVNETRNSLDTTRATINRENISENINNWPSWELQQRYGTPYIPATNPATDYRTVNDFIKTSQGEQLAGSGVYRLDDGRQYRKLTRDALPFPYNYDVFHNGNWTRVTDLQGGAANALSSYPTTIYVNIPPILKYRRTGQQLQGGAVHQPLSNLNLLEEESRVPRSGGLNPLQFQREFPPVVYNHPFDGSELYFPKEFSPLFDPATSILRTTNQTLQYAPHN